MLWQLVIESSHGRRTKARYEQPQLDIYRDMAIFWVSTRRHPDWKQLHRKISVKRNKD
jgi:hypothetical protein